VTRIIAGEFGGRRLAVPRGNTTRPTADRVREAWMSILGPKLDGAVVLDLFAGSGALGLEAISRGAASTVFVERAVSALDLIRRNIDLLGVADRTRIVRGDAMRFALELGTGVYDIAVSNQRGEAVAAFRGRSYSMKGRPLVEGLPVGTPR